MRSEFITKHRMEFDDREAEIIQQALRTDAAKRKLAEETRRSLAIKVGKDRSHIHWAWELEAMIEAITTSIESGDCTEEEAAEWRTVCYDLEDHIDKRNEVK